MHPQKNCFDTPRKTRPVLHLAKNKCTKDMYKRIAALLLLATPFTAISQSQDSIRLEAISDNIIHVVVRPPHTLPEKQSLSVIAPPLDIPVAEQAGKQVLTTRAISAEVDKPTGRIRFYDNQHQLLLEEGGRQLTPAVFEGQLLYAIKQSFNTRPGEAYYGLGQHQDDLFNYDQQQVSLWQNNTEVAVPFLVSNKKYGILWHNYSLTKAGDTRHYQPLHALQLTARTGEKGWLTATYRNGNKTITRAESVIDYPYLNDSKTGLPAEFMPASGSVTWEGTVATATGGPQHLRFTYAGYVKVYIDDQLVFDRWRQAWNPGSGVVPVNWTANQPYHLRIEWIPDGGESYITCKWMPPATDPQKTFSFDSEAGRQLDYYFVYGENIDSIISGYRYLTGKATLVPRWAMGFWQSRERYKTQQELLETVKSFRDKKIPLDNIVQDWSYWKENDWGSQEFDATRFPNPDSMITALHKRYHTRFMISVWPKFYEGIKAYEDFKAKGWLYPRNIADRQRDWIAQGYISTFYDAFNPAARAGFWNLINKKLFSKGVDAWWMDASEPDILSNVDPGRRKDQMAGVYEGTAAEFLNAYPLQNAKGIYEGQLGSDSNRRVFLLTRSGFAGSQRYGATIWSGDIASRWSDMKAQISAGLNFSLSGLPWWTMDAGGFSVEKRFEKPNTADTREWKELMTRWYQFAAFVPIFRSHGQFPFREIYAIAAADEPAYQSMLHYNQLRYRLLPYLYSIAGWSYWKDYTLMRALVMDYPDDEKVMRLGDQYLFGPSLLVNPVYTYQATERKVYLPKGNDWYALESGNYFEGGQTISANAPYTQIPLFVKAGSIIPTGPALQYTDEKKPDTITLHVYAGQDAVFDLYEDGGEDNQYLKGGYSVIRIRYIEKEKRLTIDDRMGSYKGMLKKRYFRVQYSTPEQPQAMVFGKQPVQFSYTGKAVSKTLTAR